MYGGSRDNTARPAQTIEGVTPIISPLLSFINIFTKKEKGGKKKSKKCTLLHEGMLGWLSARAQITHPWWLDQPSTGGFEAPKTKVVIRVNMSTYGMQKKLGIEKMTHF